jgi:hypothetical protein
VLFLVWQDFQSVVRKYRTQIFDILDIIIQILIGVVGLGIAFFLGNRQIKISEKQVLLSDFQFKMNNLIQMRNETEMRIDAELQSIKSYELQ